jgi:hypothetical protein
MTAEIVTFRSKRTVFDRSAPAPKRAISKKLKKKFETGYRQKILDFVDMEARPFNYWNARPTGNYNTDWAIGRHYANLYLKACDGTAGWSHMFGLILTDMTEPEPLDEQG